MTDTLHQLVAALQQPALFPHPVTRFALVETHISIILLTGELAYKFKKPVDFGFLDFSTLEKRRQYCHEELRLNRRLAPELYLEVIPVHAGPRLGGDGAVIEYAVQMREFDQSAQFDRLLDAGRLTRAHIDALALRIADFHAGVAVAGADSEFGDPATVQAPVEENFVQMLALLGDVDTRNRLAALHDWATHAFAQLAPLLRQRKQDGFIRECHGDLHLRNVALVDGVPLAFDCIEFNASLRWIDIMSEVAFMVMDLDHRGQHALASHFLNRWLERSGDYAGLALLRYYRMYRAMVRAKVDCLRAHQPDVAAAEQVQILQDFHAYLDLAGQYMQSAAPVLLLMHGLSGSGKTTVSQFLLEQLPAIRIRSDIERKRLHGLAGDARSGAGIATGIYDRAAGERTYAQLLQLAAAVLEAGYTVIVDAAFLDAAQREPFLALARSRGWLCGLVDCQAPEKVLRQRVLAREQAQSDASEAGSAVLEHQLQNYRPLDAGGGDAMILSTGSDTASMHRLLAALHARLP
jgi:uncharacterized protein